MKFEFTSALTPALSPRRGRTGRACFELRTSKLQFPRLAFSLPRARYQVATPPPPQLANGAPSPEGEGRGEGGHYFCRSRRKEALVRFAAHALRFEPPPVGSYK